MQLWILKSQKSWRSNLWFKVCLINKNNFNWSRSHLSKAKEVKKGQKCSFSWCFVDFLWIGLLKISITPNPNAGLDQRVIIPLTLEGNNHNKGQTYLLNCVIRICGYYHLQVLSIKICGHLPSAGTFHFILWAMTLNENYNVLPLRIWGHFMQQCTVYNIHAYKTFPEK